MKEISNFSVYRHHGRLWAGHLARQAWNAYSLCFPISVVVYGLTKAALAAFNGQPVIPDDLMQLSVGVLQAPLLIPGVYLARRKGRRGAYDS